MLKQLTGLPAIHLAVLLFGVSGLFGKLLDLSAALIVFGRTFFAALALLLILMIMRVGVRIRNKKDLAGFLLMGVILAVHWTTFFHAVRISTVSIALLTFSSFPLFVTFLEPLFFNERLRAVDILTALCVFTGLILVVPEFSFSNKLTVGAFWGTISGLTFAFLSILNRKFTARYSPLTIALYQDGAACISLLPFAAGTVFDITGRELLLLIILGVVFTALAHTMFIRGMMTVRAQLASIIAGMEPLYGILFACILLHEFPAMRELVGGALIMGAVLYASTRAGA